MCTQIYMTDSGDMVQTQEELAAIVGGPARLMFVRFHDDEEPYEPDLCLCGVDVSATLAVAGYRVGPGWDDFACDYYAEPSEDTAREEGV